MGKRGVKALPIAVLEERGTGNVTRMREAKEVNEAFSYVFNELPDPPKRLSKFGRDKWNSILMQASKVNGYISWLDLTILEEYCHVCQEMYELRDLAKDRTYLTKSGESKINPLYSELNKLRVQFIQLSREFGFSPSSRTGIRLDPSDTVKKEDEFEL